MTVVFNHNDEPSDGLKGMFAGATCFLVCGGPSVSGLDLSLLNQRGIVVASVNQIAATHVRPMVWIACDPPHQFSETIWRDPGVMKFVKRKYLHDYNTHQDRNPIRTWDATRMEFVKSDTLPRHCPNVWGYQHTKGWNAETFLTNELPSWGVNSADIDPDNKGRHETVMLVSLWMLYWLGFRRIYLVGCDFKMNERKPYAFDQSYTGANVSRNNSLYAWINRRFCEAQPYFLQAGYIVINANPQSKLKAFPKVSFEEAVASATADFPRHARTDGHYKV